MAILLNKGSSSYPQYYQNNSYSYDLKNEEPERPIPQKDGLRNGEIKSTFNQRYPNMRAPSNDKSGLVQIRNSKPFNNENNGQGKRKALLIGINYFGQENALRGSLPILT
jgi:hypothetical protein